MELFKENEIKYLAGLMDADGSLSFKFCKTTSGKTYLYLILAITASEKIDRHGYVKSLGNRVGTACKITYEKETFSDAWKWHVQSRSELNLLIPRLLKHMVIKAKHWKTLYSLFTEMDKVDVTDRVEEFKELSTKSRLNVGPLKHKKHPTWAWVAGYLDGDGCYTFSKKTMHIGAISHTNDVVGLELLHKAFGGTIYDTREDNTRLWRRGAGKMNSSFAKSFLSKMVNHSRLKKYKIEQMLNFHNQPQRLTDISPKG